MFHPSTSQKGVNDGRQVRVPGRGAGRGHRPAPVVFLLSAEARSVDLEGEWKVPPKADEAGDSNYGSHRPAIGNGSRRRLRLRHLFTPPSGTNGESLPAARGIGFVSPEPYSALHRSASYRAPGGCVRDDSARRIPRWRGAGAARRWG